MVFGDLDNPNSTISKLIAQKGAVQLHPEFGTNPSNYYVPHAAVVHARVADNRNHTILGIAPTLIDLATNTSSTTFVDSNGEFVFRNLKVGNSYSLNIGGSSDYFPFSLPVFVVTSEYMDLGTVTVQPNV